MPVKRASSALLFSALFAIGVAHAADGPERFHPSSTDFVVLESVAASPVQAQAPANAQDAEQLAERYLKSARSMREPRYFGRAEAALKPWLNQIDGAPHILVLQADIQQNRHDFAGARALLDRAIAADPGAPRARLMRATLLMVLGDPAQARSDCAALMGSGQMAVGSVCLAQSMAGTGQLQRAATMLEMILIRTEWHDPATRSWAQASLADFSMRSGDLTTAARYLRSALEATPQDESIRSALADVLIASGEWDEALRVTSLPRSSVGLLVRRLLAQTAARDAGRQATLTQIQELLRLEDERNERVHLREETLLSLGSGHAARDTLKLAQANFAVQREAIDARLLARAAVNAGDEDALEQLRHWREATGFQDRLVDQLLNASGSRS